MAHWSEEKEKGGGYWQLLFMFKLRRFLGRRAASFFLRIVIFFFYIGSSRSRAASRSFLQRAARFQESDQGKALGAAAGPASRREADFRSSFAHFVSFGETLIDKIDAWSGLLCMDKLEVGGDDYESLVEGLGRGEGALLLCSHLGNAELLRALAGRGEDRRAPGFAVISIVDFENTARFNRLIAELDPRAMTRLVSASDVGPETVIQLRAALDAGGLVVIAGDRVAKGNRDFSIGISFLGEQARFPLGPFVLADLLEAPVYMIHALRGSENRSQPRYRFHVRRCAQDFGGPRRGGRAGRKARAARLAREFAAELEAHCAREPLQWYNFYDFWDDGQSGEVREGTDV